MVARILVPYDGSSPSRRALEHTIEKFPSDSITSIYVINPVEAIYDVEAGGLPVAETWYENAQERADSTHRTAIELAEQHDVELDTVTVAGKPAREILEYAEEHGTDQIVMGSHGREGLSRAILGSVAEAVIRRAAVPVTIVR